ncbi:MAG: hypothetical protein ACE5I3_02430 [Phycisphaerae bacterium]
MKGLTCNIDRAGRWARGLCGLAFLLIAALLLLRGLEIGGSGLRWTAGILAAALGAFQIFEALAGWCVTRALGFKTPI